MSLIYKSTDQNVAGFEPQVCWLQIQASNSSCTLSQVCNIFSHFHKLKQPQPNSTSTPVGSDKVPGCPKPHHHQTFRALSGNLRSRFSACSLISAQLYEIWLYHSLSHNLINSYDRYSNYAFLVAEQLYICPCLFVCLSVCPKFCSVDFLYYYTIII